MSIKADNRFVTQIVYRGEDDVSIVLGYIASYKKGPIPFKNFHWTRDGKRWSRKWLGYNEAIRALLADAGHTDMLADRRILPWPETFENYW